MQQVPVTLSFSFNTLFLSLTLAVFSPCTRGMKCVAVCLQHRFVCLALLQPSTLQLVLCVEYCLVKGKSDI